MTVKINNDDGIIKLVLTSIKHFKMFNFMCSLLILLVLYALIEDYEHSNLLLKVLSIVVFISGVYVASANKKSLITLLLLAFPWLLSEWIFIESNRTVFLSFFFFSYITIILLNKILKTRDVTLDTLYASVCVYLMLGLLWASIFGIIIEVIPGEIVFSINGNNKISVNEIIYFSYTNLTTVGYGDIVSLSPVGRILSVLEAIIGQLFLAFLVARLVSIFTHKSIKKN